MKPLYGGFEQKTEGPVLFPGKTGGLQPPALFCMSPSFLTGRLSISVPKQIL